MIRSYEDIEVYQRSKKLYPRLIRFLRTFPREGRFLKDQSARAGNTIHADIAEGFGRSVREFKMYLTRALGSCNELKSHLDDASALDYGDKGEAESLIAGYTIVSKQIYRLRENWK